MTCSYCDSPLYGDKCQTCGGNAPSNANTSGPVKKPAHMSDELFEVWRKIKPGPDYAPYRIEAAEKSARDANDRATAAEARADRLAKALVMLGGEKPEQKRSYPNSYRGGFDAATDLAASIARAAIQRETQP